MLFRIYREHVTIEDRIESITVVSVYNIHWHAIKYENQKQW